MKGIIFFCDDNFFGGICKFRCEIVMNDVVDFVSVVFYNVMFFFLFDFV